MSSAADILHVQLKRHSLYGVAIRQWNACDDRRSTMDDTGSDAKKTNYFILDILLYPCITFHNHED